MSDLMFYSILRMPYEMAMSDEMSRFQFYRNAQEAANRVERAESQLQALRDAMAAFIKAKGRYHTEQSYKALVAAFDSTQKERDSI